ncbi:hypothetical protein F511_43644 [Dorcoceras hygrometricum]|uniref:Uncharacterized protein n=1 Tax=Dorcoceras hygrometricum TaxID=472368 RepID=A0A2Z7BKQ6_9LAMI|nr:hypothetical protein F511_43644 [Dorcoceras hygrometricum]
MKTGPTSNIGPKTSRAARDRPEQSPRRIQPSRHRRSLAGATAGGGATTTKKSRRQRTKPRQARCTAALNSAPSDHRRLRLLPCWQLVPVFDRFRKENGTSRYWGRYRQSSPRPDARLLRHLALEGLTRSAWMDSPRQDWPENFSRERRRRRGVRNSHSQNPILMLNTLSSVFVRDSRIQYLCDPQWFRDTASRGPTTIVAPESQSRTCPSDHGKSV